MIMQQPFYQAYKKEIAIPAVANQKFVPPSR